MTPARLRRGPQSGVVVAEGPSSTSCSRTGRSADSVVTQHIRRLTVLRISDGLMPCPYPFVISDGLAVTEHSHPVQVGNDFDASPDHPRVHRVVIGIQSDVMIARQPGGVPPPHLRRYRRQRQHRLEVGTDPIRGCAPQHPAPPRVDDLQPLAELVVEISGQKTAGRGERPLKIVMCPFDDALMFRFGRLAPPLWCPAPRGTPGSPRQLGPTRPPPPDRAFAVPDQGARHRAKSADQLPPAGEQILRTAVKAAASPRATVNTPAPSSAPATASASGSARTRPGSWSAETTSRTAQYRQHHKLCAPPDPAVDRPDATPDAFVEHRHPTRPADPLGDHRRRHRRHQKQDTDRVSNASTADPAGLRSYTSAGRQRPAPPAPYSDGSQRPGDQLDR